MTKHEFGPLTPPVQIAESLAEHGFVVLRGALDARVLHAVRVEVESAFQGLDERRADLSEEDLRILDRQEMPVPETGRRFRLEVENYRVLDSDPLRAVLSAWAGGDFLWHYPPMLRRQSGDAPESGLPYHQDAYYTRHYARFLVCWTPLTPCGVEAPGLELVSGQHAEELPHESCPIWEHGLSPDVCALFESKGYAPALEPGDVVLFTSLTPHRTYFAPGMSQSRITIDFRAVSAAELRPEVRAQRRFVEPDRTLLVTA